MDSHAAHRRPGMRKKFLGGAAILAAIASLGLAASAPASLFEGTYSGRITGVEGHASFKGGNMKFTLSRRGKITSFRFSKVRVALLGPRLPDERSHRAKRPGVPQQRTAGLQVRRAELVRRGAEGGRDLPRPRPRARVPELPRHARDQRRHQARLPDVSSALVGDAGRMTV